jgi:2'-5' RNA ligase
LHQPAGARVRRGEEAECVRLFIALAVPEAIKRELRRAQSVLRRGLPDGVVRWVRSEQMHLTLRFLGNVRCDKVEELIYCVRAACEGRWAMRLDAEKVGFFPNERSPRVVWVGVRDERGDLASLQAVMSKATLPFTVEEAETEFKGHLTIGRVKRIRAADSRALADSAKPLAGYCFGEWLADAVEVVRSELSPGGSRYIRLAEAPLAR